MLRHLDRIRITVQLTPREHPDILLLLPSVARRHGLKTGDTIRNEREFWTVVEDFASTAVLLATQAVKAENENLSN
jgi:predicted DNA-binding ribbon-helix-helix protein